MHTISIQALLSNQDVVSKFIAAAVVLGRGQGLVIVLNCLRHIARVAMLSSVHLIGLLFTLGLRAVDECKSTCEVHM